MTTGSFIVNFELKYFCLLPSECKRNQIQPECKRKKEPGFVAKHCLWRGGPGEQAGDKVCYCALLMLAYLCASFDAQQGKNQCDDKAVHSFSPRWESRVGSSDTPDKISQLDCLVAYLGQTLSFLFGLGCH